MALTSMPVSVVEQGWRLTGNYSKTIPHDDISRIEEECRNVYLILNVPSQLRIFKCEDGEILYETPREGWEAYRHHPLQVYNCDYSSK